MKKIFFPFLLMLIAGTAVAQGPYGNEWIDFSKTYVRFKFGGPNAITKNGIYRISKGSLTAAGVPASITGEAFSLWHDGVEVPIYTTTSGAFGNGDYIEFWGEHLKGKLDSLLYPIPGTNPNSNISLFADSSVYFLTWDAGAPGNHLRYQLAPNNIPTTPPAPVPYCWVRAGQDYKSPGNWFPGAYVGVYRFFSSEFSPGEGFTSGYRTPPSVASINIPTPGLVNPGGVDARIQASMLRYSTYGNTSNFTIKLGSTPIKDSTFPGNATVHFNMAVDPALLVPTGNNTIQFVPNMGAGSGVNYYGISRVSIQYPRSFAVGGTSATAGYFEFDLDASSSAQYLEFTSFNNAANVPRLYDLTNKKYYLGNISVPGVIRFYIEPSATNRSLVLYSDNNTSNIATLLPSKTIQFTDFSQPAREGDYLILTHNKLEEITNGHNYVQDYADYRSSATGGNYTVARADVEELYDQFAYGVYQHPLAVRRFLEFAYQTWDKKPEYLYIIGRGLLYHQWRSYTGDPATYTFPVVPTWGYPGSDVSFVNFGPGRKQMMKVGRLSVWNPSEIGTYLQKVKDYEQTAKPATNPDLTNTLWKKSAVHIAGGSAPGLTDQLLSTLNKGKAVLEGPCLGMHVTTFAKSSTDPVQVIENQQTDSLINAGLNILTFHGHASNGTFDYNLNTPEKYTNRPRLPLFLALGCDVAQMFALDANKTITERWVLAPNGGAMMMVASDNEGYTNWHNEYLPVFYNAIGKKDYGSTIGQQLRTAYDSMMTKYWNGTMDGASGFNYTHSESMFLTGDPALRVPSPDQPDYFVSDEGLATIPAYVTSSLDSFRLRIATFNLGKAGCGGPDSVTVRVSHTNPSGATSAVRNYRIDGTHLTDTTVVWIPIDRLADVGLNRYTVVVDADQEATEISENNNTASLDLFIAADQLVPVYPKEFAIVHQQGVTLKASTLNPFRPAGTYRFELDTTQLFNSPFKKSYTTSSIGGVIKWKPDNFTMSDSTVYYWRTAVDSSNGSAPLWQSSSFVYLANGSPGWNQSHYFQWTQDNFISLGINPNNRRFEFPELQGNVEARNTIAYNNADGSYTNIFLNGTIVQVGGQHNKGAIQIMVLDSVSGAPWLNSTSHYMGTLPPAASTIGTQVTEFDLQNPIERQRAAHFLDSIPNGNYVLIKNNIYGPQWGGVTVDTLQADAATFGSGNTLYDKLIGLGFTMIDQYTSMKSFIFWARKGDPGVTPQQAMNSGAPNDHLIESFTFKVYPDSGSIQSTIIGPALAWTALRTSHFATAGQSSTNDHVAIQVSGIQPDNTVVPLFTTASFDTTLSWISAGQYPNLQLTWISQDTVERNSAQQRYWQVLYSPVPEAALNPLAYLRLPDSASVGQLVSLGVGIENLTDIPMDSLLVRYRVINNGNAPQDLVSKRYRPLPGLDTLHADLTFSPNAYPGSNLLFIEANPHHDQPEQYHPNNLGYVPFRVGQDLLNPLLDVTFDGVHILNRDIVSGKPLIKVLLRDENKYLRLDDTSLLALSLRYPGETPGTSHAISFDGTISKFFPASGSGANEARIEFRPTLLQDGIYELIVNGKDKSGNTVSTSNYRIEFEVVNKSTITSVLNYPNPFSTSTAFVFTLTGSQIPSQFKIQILSVTGKVVREITRDELGPIHIGRNITDYKWDGRDQYGQLLGNGVYLYRVITSINGQDVEERQGAGDKFFKNGYGKMYIMR